MIIKKALNNDLQHLIHINMINYWKLAAKTNYLTLDTDEISIKTVSRMQDALLNSVLSLHHVPTEKMLVDILKFYKTNNLSFCWWVRPNQYSAFLCETLMAYHHTESEIIQGMAMSLPFVFFTLNTPENIHFKKITHEFSDWITPIKIAFNLTDDGAAGYENIYRDLSVSETAMQHYVAYDQDKPVSSCSFFLDEHSNTIGIYNFAAIPSVRKKGISTALIQYGLSMIEDQKYKIAVLQATPFSENLFKKIGFESQMTYRVFQFS